MTRFEFQLLAEDMVVTESLNKITNMLLLTFK